MAVMRRVDLVICGEQWATSRAADRTTKTILCIMEVILFAEYIHFQLRCVTKQLITMHDVFLCTLSRVNCIVHRCTEACWTRWYLFFVRELSE